MILGIGDNILLLEVRDVETGDEEEMGTTEDGGKEEEKE